MFDAINRTLALSHLLDTYPNQHSTATPRGSPIADDPRLATLAPLNPGQLLGFAVKLLDFPAEAHTSWTTSTLSCVMSFVFALAISIWIVNAVINDPELVGFRIDIHANDNIDAHDDAMLIVAVLPPYQFDVPRKALIQHGIIKDHKTDDLSLHILPHQPQAQFAARHIPVRHIMAELFCVVDIVDQCVIDWLTNRY